MRGWFQFSGTRLYLPPAGTWASNVILSGRSYEPEVSTLCATAAIDGSTVFDVGANIGVSALPLLASYPNLKVVSFEPSPDILEYITRTRTESPYANRWEIISKAVADTIGERISFHVNPPGHDALNGIRNTHRYPGEGRTVEVVTTTLDREWQERNRPHVSLIKVDVEGAESMVFSGGREIIRTCRPVIVTEWSLKNLKAYGTAPAWILDFAAEMGYRGFLIPGLAPIGDSLVLSYQLTNSENLLLLPMAS